MPFPKPRFESGTQREKIQKGKHTYPLGSKMKKGSHLDCLGCKGKNPDCRGCGGTGKIKV